MAAAVKQGHIPVISQGVHCMRAPNQPQSTHLTEAQSVSHWNPLRSLIWRCYSKCCTVLEMKNQLWCGWGQHPLSWANHRWLLCTPRSRKPVASKPPPQVSPAPGSLFVFPWIHLEKGEDGKLFLDQILFIKPLLTFSDPVTAQQQGRAVLELSLHAVSNANWGEWGKVNVDGGRLKIFLLWAAPCKVIQEITFAFKFYERALKHKMPFI